MKKTIFLILALVPFTLFAQLPDFYHNYDEVIDSLLVLESLHPDIMDVYEIGRSTEDSIAIYAVKISANVQVEADKPRLLFVGQVHAEENLGFELLLSYISDIVNNSSSSPYEDYLYLSELYFLPSANPEGLSVVTTGLDLSFRKNKRDNIGDGIFRSDPAVGWDTSGVDLNRNFSFNWANGDTFLQGGHVERYDYYRGSAPFSENESQVLKQLAIEKRFILAIVYHQSRTGNFSENVIYAWNWEDGKFSPDFDVMNTIGIDLSQKMHKLQNPSQPYEPHGSTGMHGNSHDWFYRETGCYQYTIETSSIPGILHPQDEETLIEIIEDNKNGIEYLIQRGIGYNLELDEVGHLTLRISESESGNPLSAQVNLTGRFNAWLPPRYSDPVFGRIRFILNHGSFPLEITKPWYAKIDTVLPVSQYVITNHSLTMHPLPVRTVSGTVFDLQTELPLSEYTLNFEGNLDTVVSVTTGNFSIDLPQDDYSLRIDADGYVSYFQDVFHVNHNRELNRDLSPSQDLFFDDFEAGASNWTTGGNVNWNTDNLVAHSGTASFADSPEGQYANNITAFAEFSVDLTGIEIAHLSFWHKYFLEPEADFGFVEVSTDGGTGWTTISEYQLQDIDWTQETLNLKPFCGHQVIIRFTLETDQSITENGWNIDDVVVKGSTQDSSVQGNPSIPQKFYLGKPYPNPFNSSIRIKYSLTADAFTSIKIYDSLGRHADTVVSQKIPAGINFVTWNAKKQSSGIYFLVLESNSQVMTRKIVLLK